MKLIKQAISDAKTRKRRELEQMYEQMDGQILDTLTRQDKSAIVERIIADAGQGLARIEFVEQFEKTLKIVDDFSAVPIDCPRAKKLIEVAWKLYSLHEKEAFPGAAKPFGKKDEKPSETEDGGESDKPAKAKKDGKKPAWLTGAEKKAETEGGEEDEEASDKPAKASKKKDSYASAWGAVKV